MKRGDITLPRNITLADPQFYESSDIDILVGAEMFWQLLCVGQIRSSSSHPTLQKTRLGWILAGRVGDRPADTKAVRNLHISIKNTNLQDELHQFWRVEEIQNSSPSYSPDELLCETHFINNVARDDSGRFVVKLPIKDGGLQSLGDSRTVALRRFHNIEKRLSRDANLKRQYVNFMSEYRALGHMRRVYECDNSDEIPTFYLPHHCVFKGSGTTAKIRVVFDGSCRSSSGASLNDVLVVGPVIQQDLFSIISRFRAFTYVFTADIVKMYRQIQVHDSQTPLQRIFWRDDASDDPSVYELTTFTYGTASASYLSTRCLQFLAEGEASRFPIGSMHVLRDFYVDNILTGADSLHEARTARDQIIELLRLGSFELSKWSSNVEELLQSVSGGSGLPMVEFNKDAHPRILGIRWNPTADVFQFQIDCDQASGRISKRTMLSEIAKLYDPLGLISPVVIVSKLLLQEIWKLDLNWDESVPIQIHSRWSRFKDQLNHLNQLRIPRRVKFSASVEIHGFCDASQNAYGACIYLRSRLPNDTFRIELLCSKSRVAPLKAVSLPRLELCAALLLAQLLSKITLNWISSCSRRWSTFVANRVGEIQRLTDVTAWRHVPTAENPADLISRGVEPSRLSASSVWWHGPGYLQNGEGLWPSSDFTKFAGDLPEERRVTLAVGSVGEPIFGELIHNSSSFGKACRVAGYCVRFIKCFRNKCKSVPLSPVEITEGAHALCRDVQYTVFPDEIQQLSESRALNPRSILLPLSPFLGDDGLLRVEGRLKRSSLPYSTRHPILLPKRHRITNLIIAYEHGRSLHAGVQATIAAIRQRFWPLSIRSTARRVVRECVTCFKSKPIISEATMGELPPKRVEPSRPFLHCGVDYAGPVYIREGRRRNSRHVKAYLAVFVCFAVKAIHLELVGDLTSEAFLGAFKRFISRRGKVASVHSDNGTTFVGANPQLREFYDFYASERLQGELRAFLCDSNIEWSFIPPNAPHFGGLWESAVKSVKHHKHRIIGDAHLTFEEMQTVLCEIEAILNSRPITPMSEDPNDLSCLTPGHFLVGEPLNSFPQLNLCDLNENRLSRWQRVEQLRQHFWRRWSQEYLTNLQQRHKWKATKGQQLKVGQLVLIRQPGLAPLQWLMGRVLEIHPGNDGIVRTATVRTSKGELVRPLVKLSILPIET